MLKREVRLLSAGVDAEAVFRDYINVIVS